MGGEHPPSSWAEEKLHLHLMCDVEMVLIAHLMERGLRFFIFFGIFFVFLFFSFRCSVLEKATVESIRKWKIGK